MYSEHDFSSQNGAIELRDRVRDYWRSRGYDQVEVWIQMNEFHVMTKNGKGGLRKNPTRIYSVRSNLGKLMRASSA